MGRCCAISGCLSGRKAYSNIKKVSLFKAPKRAGIAKKKFVNYIEKVSEVPKLGTNRDQINLDTLWRHAGPLRNIDMLIKWSNAINEELTKNSYVCEQHFDADDVITTDKTVLKDGNIFVYKYKKIHLKKNAIPYLNRRFDDSCPNINHNINSTPVEDTTPTSTEINIPNDIKKIIIDDDVEATNGSQKFSLDTVETILENEPLRKNWSWTIKKNSYILLSYINSKLELECHIKIDINLKVTITNAKTNILIDTNTNILSIDSVWHLLTFLENSVFCSGTGYENKKCAPTCTGILSKETLETKFLEYRCIDCHTLRQVIRNRKKKAINYEARWKNAKHRLILERKRLGRVIQQVY